MKRPGAFWTLPIVATSLALCSMQCKPDSSLARADAAPEISVEFVGRCVNATPGTPFQSLFFFPKQKEMFLYGGTEGALRVPVSVIREAPRRLDFTYRTSNKDEPPLTHTGYVVASANDWQFTFDTIADSECQPVVAPDFYSMLPDLGFAAGSWEESTGHFGIVIAADAQVWLLSRAGATVTVHYRVLEQSDNGTIVASYGHTPGDGDDESWAVSRLSRSGDTILHELQNTTVRYKLVSAAPILGAKVVFTQ
jgi:hypothetical protein